MEKDYLTIPFRMSKKHKDMFVKALRSENYTQITGDYIKHWKDVDKPCLCAAGVYLAQLNGLEDLWEAQEGHDMCSIDFGDFFRYRNNEDNDLMGHIIDMNDSMDISFEGIADWIDKNVEDVE